MEERAAGQFPFPPLQREHAARASCLFFLHVSGLGRSLTSHFTKLESFPESVLLTKKVDFLGTMDRPRRARNEGSSFRGSLTVLVGAISVFWCR